MKLTFSGALIIPAALAVTACSSSSGTGSSTAALLVVHTRSAIVTVPVDDANSTDVRARVDAFYPSICLDVDEDENGVPDTIDVRHSGEDSRDDEAARDLDHRCQPCNRGPGKADDFRLKIEGSQAELARGRVFQRGADGTLTVPSPDGPITI